MRDFVEKLYVIVINFLEGSYYKSMSTKNKEFRVSNGSFLFIFLSAINTHPYMKERIRRYIKC